MFNITPCNDLEKAIILECEEMAHTLIHKNREYGNSFTNQLNRFGILSLIIRLNDKMSRLESIYEKQEQQIVFESAMDTVTDIGGYCILTNAIKRIEGDNVE